MVAIQREKLAASPRYFYTVPTSTRLVRLHLTV